MKAMVLKTIAPVDSAPLSPEDLPEPTPGDGEVRVKVSACGLCRTDLHVIEGDLPEPDLPLIPGHQVVGTVDRLGPGCERLSVGDRVGVAWLRGTCGQCRHCTAGRENLCPHKRFTGYHADGGFAEYTLVPEDWAYAIPEAFSDAEATPLLCAGIVGYRSFKRARPRDGGTLAIYGFGSSAHIVCQIAVHRGMDVYVVSRSEDHLQLARDLGAVWASQDADGMPVDTESAIVFAPVGELIPVALEHLAPAGTCSLAGIYMTDTPPMDYEKHLFYERELRSVTANTREDGRELLREAAEIPIRPHTTTWPLEQANEALQALKNDQISGTGVLRIRSD